MGRIIVTENVSIDGVADGPRLFEVALPIAPDVGALLLEEALSAEALLLGRRGYEFFRSSWPSRSGAYAGRLNGMRKYVVSSSAVEPGWGPVTLLGGDRLAAVVRVRDEIPGDLLVYGSLRLVRGLVERNLVDALRLIMHPAVVGEGEPLFGAMPAVARYRPAGTRSLEGGVVVLDYAAVR